ncbi:hypothetical protein C8J57DRAFT_734510 [Mycena rebaudengoi]|nr:hypothetical protein C8J57DRAFT_734510 [Mycena rebaudengoi]
MASSRSPKPRHTWSRPPHRSPVGRNGESKCPQNYGQCRSGPEAEIQLIDLSAPRDETKYFTALQLSTILGPSARHCGELVKLGTKFNRPPLDFRDSTSFFVALPSGKVNTNSPAANFHSYFFAATLPNNRKVFHLLNDPKLYCRYYIPTRFLRDSALDTFRRMTSVEQETLCRQFSAHPQLCGAFYEVLGMKNIVVDGLQCCFPLYQTTLNVNFSIPTRTSLLVSDDDTSVPEEELVHHDRLWIPTANFPTCGCRRH